MDDFQQEPVEDLSVTATDDAEEFEVEDIEDGEPVEDIEADEGSEREEPKVTFDERQQEKVNELIHGKVAKYHEERIAREQAEARLAEYERQNSYQAAPTVPDAPNPDDFYGDPDGYSKAITERDAAIARRAEYDAVARYNEAQQARQYQQKQFERQQTIQKQQADYVQRAKKFNITEEQIVQDAQLVASVVPEELSEFIVTDEQGPLLSNYLSSNVLELENIRAMSPIQAAAYIERSIRPQLASARKKTQAPAPVQIDGGGSAPDAKGQFLKGATFE
jgi:hypothetical protein